MLLDKLEKVVCVIGGITVCGLIFLMVRRHPNIIHTAEIGVTPINLRIVTSGSSQEKPEAVKKAPPGAKPGASSPQSPGRDITLTVEKTSKKIMPSHTIVPAKGIDPLFRERYPRYESVFDEMKNAESELAETPYGTGVRLTSIAKGSIVEKVGFVPGDILIAINGRRLDSLTGSKIDVYKEGEGFYEELKGQELFEIEIFRNGQPTLLQYYIPLK
jgi:hypothetical protein